MSAARTRHAGQVLVFFALVLPIVLLPVAAYAVDAAATAAAFSRLEEVTARAAEEAAQQIDGVTLRSGDGIVLDAAAAKAIAREVVAAELGARLMDVGIGKTAVTVATEEPLILPLNFVGTPSVTLRATATARIAAGYESPSSLLPLPVSTF